MFPSLSQQRIERLRGSDFVILETIRLPSYQLSTIPTSHESTSGYRGTLYRAYFHLGAIGPGTEILGACPILGAYRMYLEHPIFTSCGGSISYMTYIARSESISYMTYIACGESSYVFRTE